MHVHMHTVCTVLGTSRDCPQKSGPRQASEHQHGLFTHGRQFPLAGLQHWAARQPHTGQTVTTGKEPWLSPPATAWATALPWWDTSLTLSLEKCPG